MHNYASLSTWFTTMGQFLREPFKSLTSYLISFTSILMLTRLLSLQVYSFYRPFLARSCRSELFASTILFGRSFASYLSYSSSTHLHLGEFSCTTFSTVVSMYFSTAYVPNSNVYQTPMGIKLRRTTSLARGLHRKFQFVLVYEGQPVWST